MTIRALHKRTSYKYRQFIWIENHVHVCLWTYEYDAQAFGLQDDLGAMSLQLGSSFKRTVSALAPKLQVTLGLISLALARQA